MGDSFENTDRHIHIVFTREMIKIIAINYTYKYPVEEIRPCFSLGEEQWYKVTCPIPVYPVSAQTGSETPVAPHDTHTASKTCFLAPARRLGHFCVEKGSSRIRAVH